MVQHAIKPTVGFSDSGWEQQWLWVDGEMRPGDQATTGWGPGRSVRSHDGFSGRTTTRSALPIRAGGTG